MKGLQLAGAPIWIPDLFNGVAILLSVGLAKWETTATRAGAVRRLLRFDRGGRGASRRRRPTEFDGRHLDGPYIESDRGSACTSPV